MLLPTYNSQHPGTLPFHRGQGSLISHDYSLSLDGLKINTGEKSFPTKFLWAIHFWKSSPFTIYFIVITIVSVEGSVLYWYIASTTQYNSFPPHTHAFAFWAWREKSELCRIVLKEIFSFHYWIGQTQLSPGIWIVCASPWHRFDRSLVYTSSMLDICMLCFLAYVCLHICKLCIFFEHL